MKENKIKIDILPNYFLKKDGSFDREEAINYALSIADNDSVVLILGKGRDNYMAIGDKKIEYNDYDVINKYFSKRGFASWQGIKITLQ